MMWPAGKDRKQGIGRPERGEGNSSEGETGFQEERDGGEDVSLNRG